MAMAKLKGCQCVKKANAALAEKNAHIAQGFLVSTSSRKISDSPVQIVVEKLESAKRSKLPTLLATYCPFCEKKYP